MPDIVRAFLSTRGAAKWVVLASLMFASLAEGFGLATLLPALGLAFKDQANTGSGLHDAIGRGFELLHLPMRLEVLLAVVGIGILVKAILLSVAMRVVSRAVAKFAAELRVALLKDLLHAKWSYFTEQPLGRFANAVSVDATYAGEAYFLAANFLSLLFQTAVYLSLAAIISWQVAVVGAGIGLAIAGFFGPLVKVTKRAGRKQQRKTAELVTLLSDALQSIKPLKAMSRQDHFIGFFEQKTKALGKALRREAFSKFSMRFLREPVFAAFALAGFYLLRSYFTISVAELIVIAVLLQRLVTKLGRLQEQLQNAVARGASLRAVQGLMAEVEAERERFTGTRKPSLDRACRLENLSFAYGDKPVLEDVSITIPARRLTLIMGPSGAGKTTITDLLLGFHQPHRGRILIDGTPLGEIDIQAWRRMVGYVPQELTLFHDTIQANVTLGDPTIDSEQVIAALETAGAWDFVSGLPDGPTTTVGERGAQLSGGQRQRIALARALVTEPQLLILDEVTNALDPATELEICQNIRALTKDLTIIAITHRPVWAQVADQTYQLDQCAVRLVKAA